MLVFGLGELLTGYSSFLFHKEIFLRMTKLGKAISTKVAKYKNTQFSRDVFYMIQ